jgi:hypothetical protein
MFAITTLGFIAATVGLDALLTAETRYRLSLDPLFIIWAWIALGFAASTDTETRQASPLST